MPHDQLLGLFHCDENSLDDGQNNRDPDHEVQD